MAVKNKETTAFVLDDRSIEKKLDVFRQYSQVLPFESGNFSSAKPAKDDNWPQETNWAQVFLGYEAGAYHFTSPNLLQDEEKTKQTGRWLTSPIVGQQAWSLMRSKLASLYSSPEGADGQLPPEQAFLLTLMGLLETPQALLNQLPARHRTLYYQQMLALKPRGAKADSLTVHFGLAEGSPEQVLPAGLMLDAGQDSAGTPLRYALTQPLSVNAARVTDLRWVVRDACAPGGRRARVVLDESAGVAWPTGGVRLFEASPVLPGKPPRADEDRVVHSGRIIESSLFAVTGGRRTWTVNFSVAPKGLLHAAISIADKWVDLKTTQADKTMTLSLAADGGVPAAVTALDGLTSTAPLLRLTSETGAAVPTVASMTLNVNGAVGVLCADDEGTALTDGGLPFGETAETGRGVNLMSKEWWQLGDRLKTVTVTPTWAGLPGVPFKTWYGPDASQEKDNWLLLDKDLNVTTDASVGKTTDKLTTFAAETLAYKVTNGNDIAPLIKKDTGYPGAPAANTDFAAQAMLTMQDGKNHELASKLPLFSDKPQPQGQPLTLPLSSLPAGASGEAIPDSEDPAKWPWYLRLSLNKSFLQRAYAEHQSAPTQIVTLRTREETKQMVPVTETVSGNTVYKMVESSASVDGKKILLPAMKEITASTETPVPVRVPKAQWREPYLPQWTGIEVDYTAQDDAPGQRVITPFGYAPEDETLRQPSADAELYLGIDGIEAGQLLSLHWQLRSPAALPLEWQYLMPGERWARLPMNDETNTFSSSGNVSVDWPGDATRLANSMPAGRMWLRGRLNTLSLRDPNQMALPTTPWLTGLITNAATATLLSPQDVRADHFITGLPAHQVTQALNAPESVQTVEQPWPSSGGQPPETRDVFEARVARRLRHRERALNDLDLMTLLKEQNPGIRELSVLMPVRDERTGTLTQTLVVMPGAELSDSDDASRPALSLSHLDAMRTGLTAIASPWLTLRCVNPVYVPVSVGWVMDYATGLSRTTVDARARTAMEAAFMPWREANDEGRSVIGRKITHSTVRDVLRSVPGVTAIQKVYLNGSETIDPPLSPDQVAVLTTIPTEYVGLTLVWERKDGVTFGELTLSGDGKSSGVVSVRYPKYVTGLRAEPIETSDADISLIDLDSGLPLPDTQTAGFALWAKKAKTRPSTEPSDYADPRWSGQGQDTSLSSQTFEIGVAANTRGVWHIGVAFGLKVKGVTDATLLSTVVGQRITLNVKQS